MTAALIRTGRSNLAKKYLAEIRQSDVGVKGFDELRFDGEAVIWEVICNLEMEGDKGFISSSTTDFDR